MSRSVYEFKDDESPVGDLTLSQRTKRLGERPRNRFVIEDSDDEDFLKESIFDQLKSEENETDNNKPVVVVDTSSDEECKFTRPQQRKFVLSDDDSDDDDKEKLKKRLSFSSASNSDSDDSWQMILDKLKTPKCKSTSKPRKKQINSESDDSWDEIFEKARSAKKTPKNKTQEDDLAKKLTKLNFDDKKNISTKKKLLKERNVENTNDLTKLDLTDPNPSIWKLFNEYDDRFFHGLLHKNEVRLTWSNRLTTSAGNFRTKERKISLSYPLLKLRPTKDLIETLLHEMIHAFLSVTKQSDVGRSHGPVFINYMKMINSKAGTNITVYHDFHEEVEHYKKFVWRCDGPCRFEPPNFGVFKRACNKEPGSYDLWWKHHQKTCGGVFVRQE